MGFLEELDDHFQDVADEGLLCAIIGLPFAIVGGVITFVGDGIPEIPDFVRKTLNKIELRDMVKEIIKNNDHTCVHITKPVDAKGIVEFTYLKKKRKTTVQELITICNKEDIYISNPSLLKEYQKYVPDNDKRILHIERYVDKFEDKWFRVTYKGKVTEEACSFGVNYLYKDTCLFVQGIYEEVIHLANPSLLKDIIEYAIKHH